MQKQVDTFSVQFLQNVHQILQAAAQPIDGPCRDHIDLLPGNRLEQLVEPGAAITALGTADALVFEHGHPRFENPDRRRVAQN